MKKKTIKIILIILIFAIALTILGNFSVQAITDPLSNPGSYKPGAMGEEKELKAMVGTMLGVINTFGVVVSVITLMIIGVKYMTGSVEEKAEYKKTLGVYVTGAVILFSITTLANVLYKLGSSF